MMRLDRPLVRVGFSAASIRKMGETGRDGKAARGKIRLLRPSSGNPIHPQAVGVPARVMATSETFWRV
jgi:hypothetical protein